MLALEKVQNYCLERLVLLQDHETKLQAFRFGVVKQELAEVHVATSCADKHTTAFDLDLTNFGTDKISAWSELYEG